MLRSSTGLRGDLAHTPAPPYTSPLGLLVDPVLRQSEGWEKATLESLVPRGTPGSRGCGAGGSGGEGGGAWGRGASSMGGPDGCAAGY
jgi:hypothetical protein